MIDPTAGTAIERFSLLWSRLRSFLGVLAVVLTVVMLATAAKYHANNSFTPPRGSALPEVSTAFLLVSGTSYGAILLAVYLPPYYATRQAGERLARALCDPPINQPPGAWLALSEERQRYRTAMGLDESAWQQT